MTAPMSDERLAEIEKAINDLGAGTPEYHDALAFYFMTLARGQWRRADLIRAGRRDSAKRREAAKKRKKVTDQ